MRAVSNSPLRYPGGKAVLSEFLAATIERNAIEHCIYVEPYAGGAGAAINLLLGGQVERVILNDADRSIWAFWHCVLNKTKELVELIRSTPVTVAKWREQREIYRSKDKNALKLGFSAFFLNRCNRSGILTNGGVIGGLKQGGKWKIDARYNHDALISRIEAIAHLRANIEVHHLDAIDFLRSEVLTTRRRCNYLIYLDPPYCNKGSELYLNYYTYQDHAKLARFLRRLKCVNWLVTYDNTPVIRNLYDWLPITDFNLRYSAAESRTGQEILIASPELRVPVQELKGTVR
jgi:DNA adenine methylase